MVKKLITISIVGLLGLLGSYSALAQDRKIDPSYQTTSTVFGGTSTGLFNTLGTRTLKGGEFTFGAFWNNYDRDPGDLDINQIPINFTLGLTDRWEAFANIDFFQQVTVRQVTALSGAQFNGVRSMFANDPFAAFGPPVGGRDGAGAAYFPGSGAIAGGILPPPGAFFGPFVTDRPSFYNDLPFVGAGGFNPRTNSYDVGRSGNGTGNVTLGTKVSLLNPDRAFSLAVAGIFRLSTSNNFHGMANGRGAGEIDYGPVLILGQSAAGHRVRFTQNIGYIRSGDPDRNNIKMLDRRDQLMLNAGLEVAPHQKVVLTGELNSTVFVGSGTPNLNPVNPVDLVVGMRYLAWDGRFNLGAGYRRFMNNSNGRVLPGDPSGTGLVLIPVGSDDVNGFVFNIGLGRRIKPLPPPPPNSPPMCALESSATTVPSGETVTVSSRVSDPDNDVVNYTWGTTGGRLIGTGAEIRLDTSQVNTTPGAAPEQVTIKLTVDDGRGGTSRCEFTFTVNAPEPPPAVNRPPSIQGISCNQVIGTPLVAGQVTDGETVRVRATATDPDGDPLTYAWSASTGRLRGSGSDVTLDTAGVTDGPGAPPVTITISLTASDGKGGSDTASCTLTVNSVKKPEAERLQDLYFPRRGARVDNVHKAILDDVALRLQQEPGAQLVIDGHTDKGEPNQLAQRRADNVKAYLVKEKGIDPDRIIIRAFGADRPHVSGDRAMNRRVELWIVPPGADIPND